MEALGVVFPSMMDVLQSHNQQESPALYQEPCAAFAMH